MIETVSRALMALAAHALGDHRREWALAMQVELEAAHEDGTSLSFAFGCLVTACRELPAHESGRFALASYILALGIVVPVAAMTIASLLAGFPASYLGHVGVHPLLEAGSGHGPLLSEGNRFAVPSLALLVLTMAALNLRIAWLALERDWTRLIAVGAMTAAVNATLLIISIVVFADLVAPLVQVALLAVELAAASALARWHAQLTLEGSPAPVL
jgi:hypothetical protein